MNQIWYGMDHDYLLKVLRLGPRDFDMQSGFVNYYKVLNLEGHYVVDDLTLIRDRRKSEIQNLEDLVLSHEVIEQAIKLVDDAFATLTDPKRAEEYRVNYSTRFGIPLESPKQGKARILRRINNFLIIGTLASVIIGGYMITSVMQVPPSEPAPIATETPDWATIDYNRQIKELEGLADPNAWNQEVFMKFTKCTVYTVRNTTTSNGKDGERLGDIAFRLYGNSEYAAFIHKWNGYRLEGKISNNTLLPKGMQILVYDTDTPSGRGILCYEADHETLRLIAKNLNTSIGALVSANPGLSSDPNTVLYPGSLIQIPENALNR